MPRLVYPDSALRDLAGIADDMEAFTGSREAALASVTGLTRRCERIAALPGLLGRRRPELRSDCRSVAVGSYLVFFRYLARADRAPSWRSSMCCTARGT